MSTVTLLHFIVVIMIIIIIMLTFVGFKYIFIVCSILTLFCNAISG